MKRIVLILMSLPTVLYAMEQSHKDIISFFILLYSKNAALGNLIEEELEREKNKCYTLTCPYCTKTLTSKLKPQVLKDNALRHMRIHHHINNLPANLQLYLQNLHNELKKLH